MCPELHFLIPRFLGFFKVPRLVYSNDPSSPYYSSISSDTIWWLKCERVISSGIFLYFSKISIPRIGQILLFSSTQSHIHIFQDKWCLVEIVDSTPMPETVKLCFDCFLPRTLESRNVTLLLVKIHLIRPTTSSILLRDFLCLYFL